MNRRVLVSIAALPAVAFLSLLVALAFGGGAEPQLILDPGPAARYGLPAAKMLVNIASAMTIGSLILALLVLPARSRAYGRAVDVAAVGSTIWALAAGATGFFSFMVAFNQTFTLDASFGSVLSMYLTGTELGQAWLATTLITAGLSVLCFAIRNQTALVLVLILAVAGLVPMSTQGHQGGTADHDPASMAIFIHVLAACIWLGGLVAIVAIKPTLTSTEIVTVLRRYSTLALLCFIAVATSGYLSAQIRVEDLANIASAYGVLVVVKVAALIGLGVIGACWRRGAIARAGANGPWFWAIAAGELAFMGLASGVAAALARTPTPVVPEIPALPTPSELLTGNLLPPLPSFTNYITLWNFDPLWILICGFALFFYLAGVRRLKRRGDAWPVHRTVLWIAGIAALFYVTNGGVNLYGKFLFSSHMLGHMALGMLVPLLLVPAAPITLALRTIERRTDSSRGPREWIMLVVHSRVFGFFTRPVVAAVLFAGSLWVFYYTPLFQWAVSNHVGHQWMVAHFLLTGYLFVQSIIGIDPSPVRAPYPVRLLILLATMAFHAFFGLALLSRTTLLLPDWYGAMGWETVDPLADQQAAGGIAWSVGEIPTVILAIAVVYLWSRSDTRESKRYDRKADRDHDAELDEYNRMLSARAAAQVIGRNGAISAPDKEKS